MRLSLLILAQLVISSAAPIASALLDSHLRVAAVKIIYALSFVVPYLMWKRMFKPIGASYYTHDWCEYKRPAFFIAFAAIVALLQINIVILELFKVNSVSSENEMLGGFFGFLFSLLMYCVLPSVAEELFSRGAIMRAGGFGFRAALLSGIVFGLCHFNPLQLIYAAGSGIVLSVLFLYTDDIKLTVYLHFTVNTVVLVLSYLAGVCSVGVYVAVECITWLAVLSAGVYYSWVLLRYHHTAVNEKTEEIRKRRADITLSEIFSPAMIVVYAVIFVATLVRIIL